jgi:hypothetical protein
VREPHLAAGDGLIVASDASQNLLRRDADFLADAFRAWLKGP